MVLCAFAFVFSTLVMADNSPTDPGPRGGNGGAGGQIANLTVKEAKFFDAGADEFQEVQSVTGSVAGTEEGLGPRFNSNSCASCHAHPAIGGTSPATNPQLSVATQAQVNKVTAVVPIISATGPVREVRFVGDGGVHDLFTIAGLPGTPGNCTLSQPDFETAAAMDGGFPGILRFRIPTPTFGLGLIEAIEDFTILNNVQPGKPFGIAGKVNRNGNDGTVTRFGWKAQNKSLVIFSGEAYNVEQGITNELFPDERGEGGTPDSQNCRRVLPAPQDYVNYELTQPQKVVDNVNALRPSCGSWQRRCRSRRTRASPKGRSPTTRSFLVRLPSPKPAVVSATYRRCPPVVTQRRRSAGKPVNLFSDLLVHDVGTSDDISQGGADGTQFRTAPLWGVGQRLFFLHDGRTSDIVTAIKAHGGEATRVINNFNGVSTAPDNVSNLSVTESQNLVYFLRSL